MTNPIVLITRPKGSAESFADDVKALGLECLIAPMLEIQYLDVGLKNTDQFQSLVLTSAHAVKALAGSIDDKSIPVYTVGQHTAETAKSAGFTKVYSADGDVDDLVKLLNRMIAHRTQPLLYLHGEHIARPLEKLLAEHGIKLETSIVYTQKQTERFDDATLDLLKSDQLIIAPFFSPRTAQTFVSLIEQNDMLDALSRIKALCISNEVLKCVQHYQWASTHVSQTPDRAGIIGLIKDVQH